MIDRYDLPEGGRHRITYLRYYSAQEELRDFDSLVALDLGYDKGRALSADDLIAMSRAADASDLSRDSRRWFRHMDLALEVSDSNGEINYAAITIAFNGEQDAIDCAIANARLLAQFTGRSAIAAIAVGRDYPDLPEAAQSYEYPVLLDTAGGEQVYLLQLLERNMERAMTDLRYEREQLGY